VQLGVVLLLRLLRFYLHSPIIFCVLQTFIRAIHLLFSSIFFVRDLLGIVFLVDPGKCFPAELLQSPLVFAADRGQTANLHFISDSSAFRFSHIASLPDPISIQFRTPQDQFP
jgi:hypothetical protein